EGREGTAGRWLHYRARKRVRDTTWGVSVVDSGWFQGTGPRRTTRGWFAPKSKLPPYDGGARTPVLLRWPGHVRPGRHDDLVSTVDVVPTILAACGVERPAGLPGLSLLDTAAGKGPLKRDAGFGGI